MAEIDKFKKHFNGSVEVTLLDINGVEDIFKFKPLNVVQYATMMVLGEQIQKNPTKENAIELLQLYVGVVKASYPELDDETAQSFVVSHFVDFTEILDKLSPSVDEKKVNALKKIKEMQLKHKDNIPKIENINPPKPVVVEETTG